MPRGHRLPAVDRDATLMRDAMCIAVSHPRLRRSREHATARAKAEGLEGCQSTFYSLAAKSQRPTQVGLDSAQRAMVGLSSS